MRGTGAHERYMHGYMYALYMCGTGAHERYMHGHMHAVRALPLATGYPGLVGGAGGAAGAGGARVGGAGGGGGGGAGAVASACVRVGGAGAGGAGGAGGGLRAGVGARDGHDPIELRQVVWADGQGVLQRGAVPSGGSPPGCGQSWRSFAWLPNNEANMSSIIIIMELRETRDGRKVNWWIGGGESDDDPQNYDDDRYAFRSCYSKNYKEIARASKRGAGGNSTHFQVEVLSKV